MIDLNKYLTNDRALLPSTVEKYGVRPNSHAIVIPMFDGDVEVASKTYVPAQDGKPKEIRWTKALDGQSPPLFPSRDAAETATLIVEGEFDAMVASQELGEVVVSPTTGAKGWQDEWSKLFAGRSVVVLYDKEDGDTGAEKTAISLRQAGARPKIAHWPDDKPKGYDVTDFFREGGSVDIFRAIIESAVEYTPPGLSYNSVEFLSLSITPPKFLINRICPEQGIGFVAGPPKAFKSFLTLEMAFSIATGKAFLNRFAVEEERKVLLVQQESSLGAFQARVANYAKRFGETYNLFILSNKNLSLEDEAQVERLEAEIERVRPALVILDPLASFIEGDENSASEMGAVIRVLRRFRDDYKTGFCVVHHSAKGNGKVSTDRGGMRMRGTSAFYAAADYGLWVDRVDEESLRSKVRVELKEAEGPDPLVVEMDSETTALSIGTAPDLKQTMGAINNLIKQERWDDDDGRGWH